MTSHVIPGQKPRVEVIRRDPRRASIDKLMFSMATHGVGQHVVATTAYTAFVQPHVEPDPVADRSYGEALVTIFEWLGEAFQDPLGSTVAASEQWGPHLVAGPHVEPTYDPRGVFFTRVERPALFSDVVSIGTDQLQRRHPRAILSPSTLSVENDDDA